MTRARLLHRLLDRWPVKIVCAALAVLFYSLFRTHTLQERQVTIPLAVYTPEGYAVSSDYPDRINLTLRGDKDEIAGVLSDDVEAYADLTPHSEEGQYDIPVQFRKYGTALQPEALEMRASPRSIRFSLERRTVRSLVVQPELSGFPAPGFELTQYFVSPSSVNAVGPRSQMVALTELRTEMIDLSGRRDDFTVTARLVRPSSLISIPGGDIVEFRGVIDEAVVIRTIPDGEVMVLDLPQGLKVDGELPRVLLTVQGNQLKVEQVRPQDITFYVDGSQIARPGSYTLPVRMDIPAGLAVLQLLPQEVTVRIVRDRDGG